MLRPLRHNVRTACAAALALLCLTSVAGCVGHLASEPGVFDTHRVEVTVPNGSLHLTCVTPKTPKNHQLMILFATGDAGWLGASKVILRHLAEQGYYVAAYNSRKALKVIKRSEAMLTPAEGFRDMEVIMTQAKSSLDLQDETRTIPTGFSRGASMAVFVAAVPTLQPRLAGAVAMSLTRELDHLKVPKAARSPTIQVDEKGRLQTYPALARAGSLPVAVIQSMGDKYVPATEARGLFGPDTPTRRLYIVEATNHGFGGGRDALMRDLDDALAWIDSVASTQLRSSAR
jgi:dienelactone hydrolase